MQQSQPQPESLFQIKDIAYQNFINSIKSKETRYSYSHALKRYLRDNKMTLEGLLKLDVKDSEQLLIDYINKLK